MDCDDNDFQSQNLHVGGEGVNKFPPVLRPYALPKFDFDDSLHGPLRFDSLVETEVFLDIGSNEDNQWIEDFSRGSGGIQFSSTATETCSISRCNNVWSEATSSESVEMLLKSVAQEDIIPVQTTTKESNVSDELGCIIKQMDPNSNHDNATPSNVDVVQPKLLPYEIPENFAVLEDQKQPQVEDSSLAYKDGTSADGGVNDLTTVGVEVSIPISEGSTVVDDKCDNVDQREVDNRMQGGYTSGTQHDCMVNPAQNLTPGNDELNNENAVSSLKQIADENKIVFEIDGCEDQEEKNMLSQEAQVDDHILHENVVGSGASHLENPLYLVSEEPIAKESTIGTNSVEEASCKGDSILFENFVTGDQMIHGTHEVSVMGFEGNTTFERNEVDASNISQLDNKSSDSGASLLSAEYHKDSKEKVDGSSNNYVGDDTNNDVVCSLGETHGNNHVFSSTPAESTQQCEEIMVHECVDINTNDEDVLVAEQKIAEWPGDGSHVNAVAENALLVSEAQSDTVAVNKSVVVTPMSSVDRIAADVAVDHRDAEILPLPILGFSHSEKEVETSAKTSPDAGPSDLETYSPSKTGLKPISETLEGITSGASRQIFSESANVSQSMVGVCSAENQSEPQAAVTKEANQECTNEMKVDPLPCDSTANKGDDAAELEIENDEKSSKVLALNSEMVGSMPLALESCLDTSKKAVGGDEPALESSDTSSKKVDVTITEECERNADLEASSGSPTVISAELPQNGSAKDDGKGMSDQIVSVSDFTDADANKVSSLSQQPTQNVSKDEWSFTFKVSPGVDLPQKETGKKSRPGSTKQASKMSPAVDRSLSTPGLGQSDSKITHDLPRGSPKVSNVAVVRSSSKGNTERRPRGTSGKSTGKETTKKGTPVKETTSVRVEGDNIGNVSLSLSGISQLAQTNEMQRYGHVDSGSIKPFLLATSSSLPDLNSSASHSVVFQQPFTDLQQVQLRAQIFVYGALIQGTAPDEAYMISAFGGLDGSRSIWENVWRSCIERLNGQKSNLITPETPLKLRSGVRAVDQASKQTALQSKVTPSSRPNSKGTPPIVSPLLPLSSPLWNMPTPTGDTLQLSGVPRGPVLDYQRALSPLHPHQTPPVRNFVGHNPSWISQAPFGPWVASPHTSALDASGLFPIKFPITETVQLTTVKESVSHSSAAKHVPPGPLAQSGTLAGVLAGASPDFDVKKITAGQSSADPKPRKRKKTSVSENLGQNILQSQSQMEPVPDPVCSQFPTSVAITTPIGFVPKPTIEKFNTSTSPTNSIDLRKGGQNMEQRMILSDKTLGKVKEARVQAEDAAVLAATAVSYSQEIWNQLDMRRNSVLLADVQTKLTSAAVAISAAAAVAKAAAAAANLASNAALQAKLMAEEAMVFDSSINPSQSNVISLSDGVKNLGPASILKGDDGTSSSSILLAAREAARKRVEAASAASKQAENVDAIVKAAELAAEAVSQAGKIVAMGDPLPLSELLAAGPEGCWKVAQVTSELVSKAKDVGRDNLSIDCAEEGPDTSARHLREDSSDKRETHISGSGSGSVGPKDHKREKGHKASDSAKTLGLIHESESGQISSITGHNESEKVQETLKEKNIKEGSLVEVFKDGKGFKAAWFSGNVLSLKDGKAYVGYTELTSGEGSEKLKEWVPLTGEGEGAPEIRIARSITAMPFEGTRKRRRAAMGEYNWSVGDRVDAWVQDSWWEGVITEKDKKDETLLTVRFPVQGETSVVKAWHLRPSLMWKDGEWVEWSNSRDTDRSSHGGDGPQEKRQRLRSPVVEAKGKEKTSISSDTMESNKPDEPILLELIAGEKVFNIGKSTSDGNKPDPVRVPRTGLQKGGSKVIFGVPKPGKKRKFMEVSKHYVESRSGKINETSESVKVTKSLLPQGIGPRGWKNTSKAESIEKRAAISKSKNFQSGKVQNVSRRIPQKDNSLSKAVSVPNDSDIIKTKDALSHGEKASGKRNPVEFQPFSTSEGVTDGSTLFSSDPLPSDNLSFKKSSISHPERVSKGKLAPTGGKLAKIEEDKVFNGDPLKSASGIVEPRRSNRRIQPTSRLLEGLQSSLMVSKFPSVSQDKSHKSRGASRGKI